MNIWLFLWWCLYVLCAMVLQQQVPGLDALAPGFLLALQQGKPWQTAWLFLVFCIIQEGAGSLMFGTAMLWYGGTILLFHLSSRLFVADNLLFVIMLSASMGLYHIFLTWLMCSVQDIAISYMELARQGIQHSVTIPLIWGLAYLLRPASMRHVN